MGRDVFDTGDGVAHRRRTLIFPTQPGEHAALIETALLDHVRRDPVRRNRVARRDSGRPWRQIRIEQVCGRDGLHAARNLHRFVFGVELERDRWRAVDQFVQENPQFPARAVDRGTRRLRLRGGQLLHPRQLALQFVGEGDDGVQPDHLDCAGGLVHMRPRVLERRRICGVRVERGNRLESARQRLVDFSLHPGQWAYVEFGKQIVRHGRSVFSLKQQVERNEQQSS